MGVLKFFLCAYILQIVVVILILLFYLCTISMHWFNEYTDNSLNNAYEGETIIATQF